MNREETAAAMLVALLLLCRLGKTEEEDENCVLQRIMASQEKIFDLLENIERRLTVIEGNQALLQSLEKCATAERLDEFQEQMGIDECHNGIHNCSVTAACTDRLIGYQCSCLEGYSGDGFTCRDINECQTGTHKCHTLAKCTNTIGSYNCKCPPWYHGDGFACETPGCNPPSKAIYGLGCIIPVTKKKSWEVAKKNCRDIGARLLEKIKPDMLLQIKQHFSGVLEGWLVWIGVRKARWLTGRIPVTPRSLWRSDEPDGGKQECGWITLWPIIPYIGDAYCSNTNPSLCQRIY